MKYFLMSLVLVFQVHCVSIDKNYTSNKEALNNLCDQIIKDAGFKNNSSLEAKRQYSQCLQDHFRDRAENKEWKKGYISGGTLAFVIMAFMGAWFK